VKQEDVQALVDQLFNVDVKQTTTASQHRIYYNEFGQIVSLCPNENEEYKEYNFIRVSRDRYVELSETNLKNWMIDTGQSPPQIINITADAMASTNRVHVVTEYNPKRLFNFEYNPNNRKLKLKSKGNLPDVKTLWVTPKGQYSIMLKRITLQSTGEYEYDIDSYLGSKDISLISKYNLDMLVSYRTTHD
jgi:hypothetical protein